MIMKYFFVIVIALIQTSLNAQDNIPPKLHGNLILNNGKEIQTGKIGFISKNELYFNLAQNDSLHWIYSISLDSVKHYEFDHKIRQYAFEESQKTKTYLRLYRRLGYCITGTGVGIGVLGASTPTMTTQSIIIVMGFSTAITGLGVYLTYRAMQQTFDYFRFEVSYPYFEAYSTQTSSNPLRNNGD